MLIPKQLLDQTDARINFDIDERISQVNSINPLDGDVEYAKKRTDMIAASALEPSKDALERYIGNNDLLPINYFAIGLKISKSVGRISYIDPTNESQVYATGFFISPDLVITNNHVFPSVEYAAAAKLQMDFEFDIDGSEKPVVSFGLNPKKFFYTNDHLDYTIVGIEPMDVSNAHSVREYGFLPMIPKDGKAGLGDYVSIIQHPSGQEKQIAIRENKILDRTSNAEFLIYEADTSEGSSGSVVCNDQWQVVALHHSGKAKKDAASNYLDANNEIIQPNAQNQIDSSRIVWYANEGIKAGAIIYDLQTSTQATNPLIQSVLSVNAAIAEKPTEAASINPEAPPLNRNSVSSQQSNNTTMNTIPTPPQASITVPLTISVSLGTPTNISAASETAASNLGTEKVVIDTNYGNRPGYIETFLGTAVKMPVLSAKLLKTVSRLLANHSGYILKYQHHTTVQNNERKMPYFSIVNVDANKEFYARADEGGDAWYQDTRIAAEEQLTNSYYAGSGFDKGHMTRREDAAWGATDAERKKSNNDTFHFTNCCPQVPEINRSNKKGLWGELENFVLDNGARSGVTSKKITVINGPIFSKDDPKFKDVQVPMRFFKIVVWVNDEKKLCATAFVLSQETLVGKIEFEEFSFTDEFKTYQYKISKLETDTGLSFPGLSAIDTYTKAGDFEKVESLEKVTL